MEFSHQTSDLLNVHHNRRIFVKQAHVDALGAFLVPAFSVDRQNQIEISSILLFPILAGRSSLNPGIVAASRNTRDGAQSTDGQVGVTGLKGAIDDLVYTGRIIHEQCTYFLIFLIAIIFFRNSISCFR